ncbi:MAG: type II secretion system protein [Proteocatella sp.]
MKNLRNNLKKNKKGFTLVEIIVVLVILAILAAASIPTMLGFVEDAKGKSEIANARAAYVACQTIATEEKAGNIPSTLPTSAYTLSTTGTSKLDKMLFTDLGAAKIMVKVDKGRVKELSFLNATETYGVLITAGGTSTVTAGSTQPAFSTVSETN